MPAILFTSIKKFWRTSIQTNTFLRLAVFLFGCACFLFVHLWKLEGIPGFHFDEAWAANYSYRIAFEPHFWPLSAMSPYTAPWTHYIAAGFFRLFGVDLFIFRTSQVAIVFVGLLCTALALRKWTQNSIALLLPLFCAAFPALVINQRFAIEMTTFHVGCFGVFLLGLATQRVALWLPAVLLGVTSHVLFLAPIMAVLGVITMEAIPISKRIRFAIAATAMLLLPFFVRIAFLVPEKGKAWALVLLTVLVAIVFTFSLHLKIPPWIWRKLRWLLLILSLPFFVNLSFFSLGLWQLQLLFGVAPFIWSELFSLFALVILGILWFVYGQKAHPHSALFFSLSITFMGLLMLKPAPRYFALGLYMEAILLLTSAWYFGKRWRWLLLSVYFFGGMFMLLSQYGLINTRIPEEKEIRFLHFKDSSEDFLSKQELVRFLGLKGCGVSAIVSADGRLLEALRFLAHGDWPISGDACNGKWRVERAGFREKPQTAPQFSVAGFELWQEKK